MILEADLDGDGQVQVVPLYFQNQLYSPTGFPKKKDARFSKLNSIPKLLIDDKESKS